MANIIYYGLKESACSEQSSRMTAMDAASKNAGMEECKNPFLYISFMVQTPSVSLKSFGITFMSLVFFIWFDSLIFVFYFCDFVRICCVFILL